MAFLEALGLIKGIGYVLCWASQAYFNNQHLRATERQQKTKPCQTPKPKPQPPKPFQKNTKRKYKKTHNIISPYLLPPSKKTNNKNKKFKNMKLKEAKQQYHSSLSNYRLFHLPPLLFASPPQVPECLRRLIDAAVPIFRLDVEGKVGER